MHAPNKGSRLKDEVTDVSDWKSEVDDYLDEEDDHAGYDIGDYDDPYPGYESDGHNELRRLRLRLAVKLTRWY